MLPCATTVVIGIIDDISGSVPRISLAWRRRKEVRLVSNGWVSSQRSCCSVDATFKRTEWDL